MPKTTMQNIADALGISRVTVCKALNHQPGVSPALAQSIFNTAKELGYKSFSDATSKSEEIHAIPRKNVALIVSRPDSALFWMDIIHNIAQELSKSNINMLYISVPSSYTPEYTLPPALTDGSIHGAIIMNINDVNILSMINNLNFSKVFLDTVPSLVQVNGDLFLIEGEKTTEKIVDFLCSKHCRTISFLGDIEYAQTNHERFMGYLSGLKKNSLSYDANICLTKSIPIHSYEKTIFQFLSTLSPETDAIVCASDYVAHYVELFIAGNPGHFRKRIRLTGFDCSREYQNVVNKITTVAVQNDLLGQRLATQICYRMSHPSFPYETSHVNYEIVYSEMELP